VQRVHASDGAALRHLNAIGLSIGTQLKVLARSGYDQVTTLKIRGREATVTLGPALSGRVFVEKVISQKTRSKGTR
jgi:hypothetical protein